MTRTRRALVALLAVFPLALAGCTTVTVVGHGGAMMGGSGTTDGSAVGPGSMMGSGTGMGSGMGSGTMMRNTLTCSAPASLPGTTVTVVLGDMGMRGLSTDPAPLGVPMMLRATPVSVPAGQVSFVAENVGWRAHELVVLPLADGQTAGSRVPGPDGTVDESDSLGESSAPCAQGEGDGLTAGTVGWVTLDLAPGRYELVCNKANHYADGMWQEIVVT